MENSEDQIKFWKQYVHRQEALLLEYIRKTLELEIKTVNLSASLSEITGKYEESQKQVNIQNDLMQQAANSVEILTVSNKRFEEKEEQLNKTIEELKNSLHDCKTEREQITKQYNELKKNSESFDKKYNDLSDEYRRQTEELSKLYSENIELKPKTNKKIKATLPPDEF